MPHPLKWEFPGGKQEKGETLEGCLKREIKEELGLDITIREKLQASKHQYTNSKEICLHPFICTVLSGQLALKEHKQITWLPVIELPTLDWAEADIPILNHFLSLRQV